MADPLYELLSPYFTNTPSPRPPPHTRDTVTSRYLSRLSTLPLSSLTTDEPQSLAQSTHSTLLSIQSLSARSNPALVASADHLSSLRSNLLLLSTQASSLRHEIPKLDSSAVAFAERYSRSTTQNELLDRRKQALLMARNVDRLSDILDLPTLLSSAISTSTAQGSQSNTANYASALDLHSHIKRLHLLYQDSALVDSIYAATEEAMQEMTSNLITSLRAQNIKLAAGMRTVGWLRRVAPELSGGGETAAAGGGSSAGSLGALFLVCRLATLVSMLSALDPLRDLADQETAIRVRDRKAGGKGVARSGNDAWSGGQQTERYLKRYIEIFREQSFAIVSMYRSIFPAAPDGSAVGGEDLAGKLSGLGWKGGAAASSTMGQASGGDMKGHQEDPLNPMPSALATFPLHLVGLLVETLRAYLPNVRDKSSRESLLTQVLYCAGSLGRLGGDFGLMLAGLGADGGEESDDEDEDGEAEWVAVMKKHRVLAGKLEKMASGGS